MRVAGRHAAGLPNPVVSNMELTVVQMLVEQG